MKFPTYEEMGREVANRALDEFEYKGKTLRQWIEIILATDINVATKDSTNLAEVGTDYISREQAIDAVRATLLAWSFMPEWRDNKIIEAVERLPTIQPKRGRWIPVTNGRGGHECDQCHEYAPSYQSGEEHLSDFCPNCGADMRGKQDG